LKIIIISKDEELDEFLAKVKKKKAQALNKTLIESPSANKLGIKTNPWRY